MYTRTYTQAKAVCIHVCTHAHTHPYHGISVTNAEALKILQAEAAAMSVDIPPAPPAKRAPAHAHHRITPLVLLF